MPKLYRVRTSSFWGIVIIAILLLLLATTAVFALSPFKIKEYVTDNANLMAVSEKEQLSGQLADYANKTGNQILVVTIPSLEGNELVDYTERLFTLNKPGQKGKNNGIILLIAQKEHQIRIEAGYGLEEKVPDGKAGAIIREQITPYFKAGEYDSGILAGTNAIITAISPDYALDQTSSPQPVRKKDGALPIAGIIAFLIFIFGSFSSMRGSQVNRGRYRRGYSEPWYWGGGGSGGGSFGSGGGGGFSGGGGSFGGGGASGGW